MDSRHTALRKLDLAGKVGVEFGPLDRPLVSKKTARVYYADHCSTEVLRAKFAANPIIRASQIEEVDLDLSGRSFLEAVANIGPLDFVVASHFIEHVPDLIGWLTETNQALCNGGVLALVVPDKRFTFDLHRRETPFADMVAAHREKRSRPDLATALDHFLNIVTVDAGALWANYSIGYDAPRTMPPSIAKTVWEDWTAGKYIDAHCWVFTPWSFLSTMGRIVNEYGLDYCLKMAEPTPRQQLEFYVQLEKSKHKTDWDRAAKKLKAKAYRAKNSGAN